MHRDHVNCNAYIIFSVNFHLKKRVVCLYVLGHPEIIEASILKHFVEVWMHELLDLGFLLLQQTCVRRCFYIHA